MGNPSIFRLCQSIASNWRRACGVDLPIFVALHESGSRRRWRQSRNLSRFANLGRQNRTCRREQDRRRHRSMESGRGPRIRPIRRRVMSWDTIGGTACADRIRQPLPVFGRSVASFLMGKSDARFDRLVRAATVLRPGPAFPVRWFLTATSLPGMETDRWLGYFPGRTFYLEVF